MKIRVAVTEIARNVAGEVIQLKVVCHPHWVVYVKDPGRKKLWWLDKGPKYRGEWQEVPKDIWSAMRRRAYAEVYGEKPESSRKPAKKPPKKPPDPPKFPQQMDLF